MHGTRESLLGVPASLRTALLWQENNADTSTTSFPTAATREGLPPTSNSPNSSWVGPIRGLRDGFVWTTVTALRTPLEQRATVQRRRGVLWGRQHKRCLLRDLLGSFFSYVKPKHLVTHLQLFLCCLMKLVDTNLP